MNTPRGISDPRFLASKFQRRFLAVPRRDSGIGGRLRKNRVRALPGLEPLEDRMLLATFVVESTSDGPNVPPGTATLRMAINEVDASTDPSNVIEFDFASVAPGASHTINLFTALPAITKQVDIEGNSQPGFSGAPLVAITGGSAGSGADGLELSGGSSGSVIESLAINAFGSGDGIEIGSSNNSVIGCYIGTDVAGGTAEGNFIGVLVNGSGNTIGGTSAGAANVISGNGGDGIDAEASCLVLGNVIGTNMAGTRAVPNSGDGIAVGAAGATIGGTSAGAGNVISGNGSAGIYVAGSCLVLGNLIGTNMAGTGAVPNFDSGIFVGAAGATIGGSSAGVANVISGNRNDGLVVDASCLIEGNLIGTNEAGSSAVPDSDDGIFVGAAGATIGGTTDGTANVVSGNGGDGIDAEASCLVLGNLIGTDLTGASAVPDSVYGIDVEGSGVTIGGTSANSGNVISGNRSGGIMVGAPCLIEGNLIGTNAGGTAAVQNPYGIFVGGSSAVTGGPGATIGGTSAGASNVISGNSLAGVYIDASCLVLGNLIGTDLTGTKSVQSTTGALDTGIIVATSGATIGGTSAGAANVISGNGADGIDVGASCLVEGNRIGTDTTGANPVPNQGMGVFVDDGSGVASTIGGVGLGNVIAFNGGPGVATAPGTTGTSIEFNAIFGNGGPGIDLGDDGVTPNIPNGANNTPVLDSSDFGIITGTLDATPNSTYTVDFYASPIIDAAPARPQGRDYLGSVIVTTGLTGEASLVIGYTPIPGEPIITATSTDASGTTSEFSPPFGYVLTASGMTFAAIAGTPFQGTVASFTTSDPSATAADFSATINYGTGDLTGTVVPAPGGFVVVGSFNFPSPGPAVPITVTIIDKRGLGQATANSLADVANSGLTPFAQSVEFVAGTTYSRVVAGFTDATPLAFPRQFTASIAWGDDTTSSAGTISTDGAGFDVTGLHTYNVAGTYPIIVTIDDAVSGAVLMVDSTAIVDPVPITIQTKNFAVTGGAPFSGTVATFTDGDARTNSGFYTATINWGDNTPTTTGTITGTNPFTVTASHTFATFANTDIVTITITDKNGRTVTGFDRVVDPPVGSGPISATTTGPTTPPAAAPTPAVLAIVADALTLSPNKPFQGNVATFTDTGPAAAASAFKATINWGKGRKSAGMILGSNGRFVVSARHVFARFAGAKTVTVTITDAEGQAVSVSESASYAVRRPKARKQAKSAARPHH
jgi:hypothetical protein